MSILNRKGFTLIELIIVVIIIGIISAIAASMIRDMKLKAMITEVETGISAITSSLQQYYIEHDRYPGDVNEIASINELAYSDAGNLPGLPVRNSGTYGEDTGNGRPALDGIYSAQDGYFVTFPSPPALYHPDIFYESWKNYHYAPKGDELFWTVDDTDHPGYLAYFMDTKKFKQQNWSRTGLQAQDKPSN